MSNRVRLAKFFTRSLFQKQGRFAFILLTLVSSIAAVILHTGVAVALSNWHAGGLETRHVVTQSVNDPLQRGKDLYQAGQFKAAIAVWQQAAATFEAQGDRLNQALALTYLGSAFEQLGQWTEANAALEQAIALLSSPNLDKADTAQILATAINTQGILQLTQGQESEALETWQRAETTYRQVGDTVGILGSQMNQARALQALSTLR